MRGWKNALILTAIWLSLLVAGTTVFPNWLMAFLVVYVSLGVIVCVLLRIHAPIDDDRFDWRGVLRSLYWDLWWPSYLRRRLWPK